MPLVTVDHASLAFGDAALLDHADFSLDAAERVALIGRNGSGKTSLMKAIAGQQALDDGTVWRLPGLRIADDVVIGAGAVVTETIAKAGVYAGVPARRVR